MDCPVCNRDLTAEKYQYLPYHYCKQCGGMWVDAKLLKNLAVRMAVDLNIKPREKKYFQPQKIERPLKDDRIRLCPKCGAGMKQNNYAYDSNVIIDRCTACEGIWLDEGEIMQIAACLQIDEDAVLLGRELVNSMNAPEKMEQQFQTYANVLLALLNIF